MLEIIDIPPRVDTMRQIDCRLCPPCEEQEATKMVWNEGAQGKREWIGLCADHANEASHYARLFIESQEGADA